MKNIKLIFLAVLFISACGKKTTINGRVYNPVTNEGIAGIEVYVTKPKAGLGYDGNGTKTIFNTTTDKLGKFVIEERFRKSKLYTINYSYDKQKYKLFNEQVSPAGQEYNGETIEFPLIPLGFLKSKIDNINCFNSSDNLSITRIHTIMPSYYGGIISSYDGCFSYEFTGSVDGSPNGYVYTPMGWHKAIGIVTKNGISTPFVDSIYITEGGFHTWHIEY